jgi:hypothetical protein
MVFIDEPHVAYRPLAGPLPAEESRSSGFAEGGERFLPARFRFR